MFFVCVWAHTLDDMIFICRFGFGLQCFYSYHLSFSLSCSYPLFAYALYAVFFSFFFFIHIICSPTFSFYLSVSHANLVYELIRSLLHHNHYYYCYDSVWLLLQIQLFRFIAFNMSSVFTYFIYFCLSRYVQAHTLDFVFSDFSMNENSSNGEW